MGLLKGLVVVSETLPDPNFSEFVDMTRLRVPQTYCCRLYVVKGLHLQPKDLNGLADPYLQLKVLTSEIRLHTPGTIFPNTLA